MKIQYLTFDLGPLHHVTYAAAIVEVATGGDAFTRKGRMKLSPVTSPPCDLCSCNLVEVATYPHYIQQFGQENTLFDL